MSLLSVPIPHVEGSAPEHVSPEDLGKVKTANELAGYMSSTNKEDVQKSLLPISDNVTLRVWMSRDLSIYILIRSMSMQSPQLQSLCSGINGVAKLPSRGHSL